MASRRRCHAVEQDAQEDRPHLGRREQRFRAPALQRTEFPAVVAVAERLLEGIARAHVLPDGGRMRIAWTAIQNYAIDVPFVAHQLGEAGVLQPERAFLVDEIENGEIMRVERNGHRVTICSLVFPL